MLFVPFYDLHTTSVFKAAFRQTLSPAAVPRSVLNGNCIGGLQKCPAKQRGVVGGHVLCAAASVTQYLSDYVWPPDSADLSLPVNSARVDTEEQCSDASREDKRTVAGRIAHARQVKANDRRLSSS